MQKKKIIAAGGLVFNEQNELLMIYRREKWDLPKGKLDEGETIETCAVREVEEETGIKVDELNKLLDITFHEYFDTYVNDDVIKETHWYLMKASSNQSLIPQTEEDITAIKWVDKTELAECLQNSYDTIIAITAKLDF